jgi:hypothetical protein
MSQAQQANPRTMWNEIELLTSDDTGSGYLSVSSRKETALYQVDLLVKISSEKVVILTLTKRLLRAFYTWYPHNKCFISAYSSFPGIKVQSQISKLLLCYLRISLSKAEFFIAPIDISRMQNMYKLTEYPLSF